MKLSVLFWFYKKPKICLNRLELIKKYNPTIKIFGLYGGDKSKAKLYQTKLDKYLDKFYISKYSSKDANWKWINGDLMILDWYKNYGYKLKKWNSIIVIQWDALILGSIKKQFSGIKINEVFISGTRVLDKNIEKKWSWTKPRGKERKHYLAFSKYILEKYNYQKKLLCSLFIIQIFSRKFFDKYLSIKNKELGMLEYKIPTYAKIFNIPLYKKNLGVWWFNKRGLKNKMPLNAEGIEIQDKFINSELRKKDGYRIFHPYFKIWKN